MSEAQVTLKFEFVVAEVDPVVWEPELPERRVAPQTMRPVRTSWKQYITFVVDVRSLDGRN